LAKGTANDLRGDVPAAQLDRLRRRLHEVLWRGSTPDNDIYEHVVRLFLTKIYDEKTTNVGDKYRFQRLYAGVQPETPDETFTRINALYSVAYARYLNAGGTDEPTRLDERKFSADQTAFVVELLQGISLTSTRSGDLLGAFFEGITRDGFKQSKGLFFTHMNITTFVVKALELDELALAKIQSAAHYDDRFPYIIDPSCGSGTFLLSAMRVITDAVNNRRAAISRNEDVAELIAEKAPLDHANQWAKDFIFGIDDSELLSMATKVNMVLHRDGNTHIYKADGLASLDSFRDQRLKGQEPRDRAVYSKRSAIPSMLSSRIRRSASR
jgi:type I restriction enzyme M protein